MSPVVTCEECTEWVETQIEQAASGCCVACGCDTTGKYGIYEYGSPGPGGDLCGGCRKKILFRQTGDRALRNFLYDDGRGSE